MSMPNKQPWCVAPFNSVHIDIDERDPEKKKLDFTPCCWFKSWADENHDLRGDHASIVSYFEYPNLQRLQKDMSLGNEPSGCVKCKELENSGIESLRQSMNRGDVFRPGLKYINISMYDNQCNMKCYMCVSESSSSFSQEQVQLGWEPKEIKFSNTQRYLDMLRPVTESDINLNVIGGEPLVSRGFADLVELVLEKNWSISITSNGSVINTKAVELMKKARYSKIMLSMDGIDDFYYIMRYPFDWDNFHNNLQFYKKNLSEVSINFTAQAMNVENLVDSINYFRSQQIKLFYIRPVRSRPWLNWEIMTDSEQQTVIDRLTKSIGRLKVKSRDLGIVSGIINDIKSRTFSQEARDEFVRKITAIWTLRGIDKNSIRWLMPWSPELQERIING